MEIGPFHPQIVHFVIALAFVGVGARIVSLLPLGERFRFSDAMATACIVMAAMASALAVKSGDDAHSPVERVPGARAAVIEHEEAGELARNVLLGLAVLELATLALSRRRPGKALRVVTALAGAVALYTVYEAAEHGGELVYNYAGGVGLRSGDSADVRRLLVAGLYHQSVKAREAHRGEEAARLVAEMERQMPADQGVQLMAVESRLRDLRDARGALARLDSIVVPADSQRLVTRELMLTAEAWTALGSNDSARAVLEALRQRYPDNPRVQSSVSQALQRLDSAPAPAAPGSAPSAPSRGAPRGPR